ncbi:MAG: ABC transporter permease [Bdellovibrionia bacterium]
MLRGGVALKTRFSHLKLCIVNEFRDRYPGRLGPLGQLASELTLLTVYWFTAKAFQPTLTGVGDYFSFIVVGELALALPNFLILGHSRAIRVLSQEGTLEPILVSPGRFSFKLTSVVLAGLLFEIARVLAVSAIAYFVFEVNLNHSLWPAAFVLAFSLPMFAGLGLLSAAVVLHFGRGERVLAAGVTAAAVLSGAYFPSEVLPQSVSQAMQFLSPFTLLIEGIRGAVNEGWASAKLISSIGFFIGGGFLTLPFAHFFLNAVAHRYDRRLKPLLFRG